MIKETTVYQCADGAVFHSREDAEEHDKHMAAVSEADQFGIALAEQGLSQRQVANRTRAVIEFLEWRNTGKLPSVESTAEKDNTETSRAA